MRTPNGGAKREPVAFEPPRLFTLQGGAAPLETGTGAPAMVQPRGSAQIASLALWRDERVHVPLLFAPNIHVPHGFSTRAGGVSEGSFAGLNLGLSTGDDPSKVAENRRRFARALGTSPQAFAGSALVHGKRVVEARPGWQVEADAQVSNDPRLLLVVGAGDCFPLLFYSPDTGAVGTAHCGWRGTVAGIAGEVVREMRERYGADPARLQVAIGPGIRGTCYDIFDETAESFEARGFSADVVQRRDGKMYVDLVAANRHVLEEAGVDPKNVHDVGVCTHCEPDRFYSNRRDGRTTGRMWAGIRAVKETDRARDAGWWSRPRAIGRSRSTSK